MIRFEIVDTALIAARRLWLEWPLLLLFGGLSLFVLPAIYLGVNAGAAYSDAAAYHLPQINFFISHPLAVGDYPASSATTPGHHLVLAWISILFGYSKVYESTWIIRIANAAMGYGFVGVALLLVRRLGTTSAVSLVLVLPAACSPYVISSAIWITTDD